MKNLLLLFLLLMPPVSPAAANLSGTWTVTTDFFSESRRISALTCAMRQQGRQLSVRFGHGAELTGDAMSWCAFRSGNTH